MANGYWVMIGIQVFFVVTYFAAKAFLWAMKKWNYRKIERAVLKVFKK